ncbi:DUF1513 domain-containing protein [Marinomonas sp. 15G1-11]|uniref:DUF1513 domain-containing protein n=1 Tax=Marinomonas phaeophyticola TaxID=3004091 RepID=A0ABT4JV91_9GAMM|nr:DUF1513 domain-containing protein [Marinomonas sp. 15G1-11]MCZ2722322.1 DUF1513 domain-containing protein [Marinomonas sp. 15G1-11]
MNRRSFLKLTGLNMSLLGMVNSPLWSTKALATATAPAVSSLHQEHFASAFTDKHQQHHLALLKNNGTLVWKHVLEARAHAPVFHPNKPIVAIVARRPGFYLDLFDTDTGERLKQLQPTSGHHFYGHALFSIDGKTLITQENHYASGDGKIFVRDWETGTVLHEWPSYGIGPHQSCLMDKTTLVIANGGLKTHPDNDRKIENIDSMQPNVSFISLKDGRLMHQVTHPPELHQLSIRHLHVNQQGQVAVAFQYQGPKWDTVPLVGITDIKSDHIQYLTMPEPIRQRFKQYCGSVRFDASGKVLAVTTPRGGLVAFWSMEQQAFLNNTVLMDVCGLKETSKAFEFMVSTGRGKFFHINALEKKAQLVQKFNDLQWDNHLT